MWILHVTAPSVKKSLPTIKKEYFTNICPPELGVMTGQDVACWRTAAGQVRHPQELFGGECMLRGIIVGTFLGAAQVALELLVFCFPFSFLCFHVACH